MKKNVRTIITMMTMMVSTCIFAACGQVGETGNQVANTTEAAITTAKSKDEIITEESIVTATTTVATTAELETTTTEATTTEAVTTTAEPEITAEVTEAPADDGMYTIEECIRQIIRDEMGQEVVSFEEAEEHTYKGLMYYAYTEQNETVLIKCYMRDIKTDFNEGVKTSLDRFLFGDEELDGVTYKTIYYAPKGE